MSGVSVRLLSRFGRSARRSSAHRATRAQTGVDRRPLALLLGHFLAYFLIGSALTLGPLAYLDRQRFAFAQEELEGRQALRLTLASAIIAEPLGEVIAGARMLSRLQVLADYIAHPTPAARRQVEQEFASLAESAQIYDQVRLLDTAGRERVRVDFSGGQAHVVTPAKLQDKAARYYFRAAARLKAGQIYVSPLDLNVEHGRIEQPFKPVIRVATPVADREGRLRGVVVLNYLARMILERFAAVMAGGAGQPMMVNAEGYWLYAPERADTWGFMLGHGRSFAARYPAAWERIHALDAGRVHTPDGSFAFTSVRPVASARDGSPSPSSPVRTWKLISYRSPDSTSYHFSQALRSHAQPVTLLLLLIAGTSVLLAQLRTTAMRRSRALAESRQMLAQAQEVARLGNWVWDVPAGRLTWSEETYRIFGRPPQGLDTGIPGFLSYVHPEDRGQVESAVDTALRSGAGYLIEHRIVRPDGGVCHVQERGKVELDASGTPRRLLGTVQDITERKLAEDRVRESEARVRLLFASVGEGIIEVNLDHTCSFANAAALQLLGYRDADEIIGRPAHDVLRHGHCDEPQPRLDEDCILHEVFVRGESVHLEDVLLCRADGSRFHAECRVHPVRDGQRTVGSVLTFVDVTARLQVEEKLRQAGTVFESTNEAILITDARRRAIAVNPAFTAITGYQAEDVIGRDPRIQTSGRHSADFYREIWQALGRDGYWQGEVWNKRKNGQLYPAWENISLVRDQDGKITNYISVLSDISAIKQAEQQLHHLAHHDPLTGLPNRLLFSASLRQGIERARRHGTRLALMFLDLDRFKLINDTLGHAVGDRLLEQVATRLRRCVRAEDVVARLGGDEFTVIAEEVHEPEDAALLARKIIDSLSEPMHIGRRRIHTSASIGISLYPDDAAGTEELSKAADAAMYRAKERGRNTYEFYTAELTARAMEHLSWEEALRRALEEEQFELYYQPQVALGPGRVVGVEALLRWRHPRLGLVEPERFIGIAEDTGLIQPIGEWVLRRAVADGRAWRARGVPIERVAVNISGHQILHDHLTDVFRDALAQTRTQTPPDTANLRVEIEITESVLQTGRHSIETLTQLRRLGALIAIDDFGTGYSSLSHLKHLPIDTLKIAREFVRDIPGNAEDCAIAAAIIAMGHNLGLRVIAEGVETEGQVQFLHDHGCDEVQGFFFGPPMPAADLAGLPALAAYAAFPPLRA